jgi:hypothetical protein
VDYDATPIPGVDDFLQQLFAELLEIIRSSLRQEALDKARARAAGPANPLHTEEEESPFEDVSADRVIRVLLEEFQAVRFETVGPFIQPERRIPHYRTEPERIFQQYLAAALIRVGEQAIARGQADGQWFLFHLTPQRPDGPVPFAIPVSGGTPATVERMARLESELDERGAYIAHLESEISRKNAALTDLETRLRAHEAELRKVRAPRLPWKRPAPRR